MGQKYRFFFYAKNHQDIKKRSCSMKIFSKCIAVNISKRNLCLVICIAKHFIWTTLKAIFSIFRFICTFKLCVRVCGACVRACVRACMRVSNTNIRVCMLCIFKKKDIYIQIFFFAYMCF